MQPIKLLVIGDVHISDHAPGKRTDDYKDRILEKLNECISIAHNNDVTHILFLGDIFHVKAANRVSHRLVQEVCNVLKAFKLPVLVLVGNHDITDGTLDSISKQPIGLFKFLDNVTLLEKDPVELAEDVLVYPIAGTSDITLDSFKINKTNSKDILAVHQSIVPDINLEPEMLRHILFDAAAVAEASNFDLILYGHQHRNDGIYKINRPEGPDATFSNLGSICRLTVGDNDVDKVPQVLLLTLSEDSSRSETLEVIELQCVKPAQDVYRLEEHLADKAHSKDIDETIKKLKETEVSAFSLESVIKDVETRQDVDDQVKTTALTLLEEVR